MLPNLVVGWSVAGLAVARALQRRDPDRQVVVLEKEVTAGEHQTGHNSGVIHSGPYYAAGSRELKQSCHDTGVRYDVPGKLVVATRERELVLLDRLQETGVANGVPVRCATPDEIIDRQPGLRVLGSLVVDSTGRVDYRDVAQALGTAIPRDGGQVRAQRRTPKVQTSGSTVAVHIDAERLEAHRVACCAGLHADQLARASGVDPGVRILPFRGEYARIRTEKSGLVRGLVYPVPDPDLPCLGGHLTRDLDDEVYLAPNAVPALAREGYSWSVIDAADLTGALTDPVSWRLARRYGRRGAGELARSRTGPWPDARCRAHAPRPDRPRHHWRWLRCSSPNRHAFREGRRRLPFRRAGTVLHVLNAPAPAATANLPIGRMIFEELYWDTCDPSREAHTNHPERAAQP